MLSNRRQISFLKLSGFGQNNELELPLKLSKNRDFKGNREVHHCAQIRSI